jgi:hypothetical protein
MKRIKVEPDLLALSTNTGDWQGFRRCGPAGTGISGTAAD